MEELQQVSQHLDKLYVALMIERAKFLVSKENLPKSSILAPSSYITNHSKKGRKLIEGWKCNLCGSSMSDKSLKMFDAYVCQSGHAWPICNLSLQVCDSTETQKCSWCGSVACGELDKKVYGYHCTLCGGCIQ